MKEHTFIVKDTFFISSRKILVISGKLSCDSDTVEKGDFVKIDEYLKQIDAIEVINSNNKGYIGLIFNFQEIQDLEPLELLKNNDKIVILSERK
jgi:hypothetical protein